MDTRHDGDVCLEQVGLSPNAFEAFDRKKAYRKSTGCASAVL